MNLMTLVPKISFKPALLTREFDRPRAKNSIQTHPLRK
jgi:hypothetical protein